MNGILYRIILSLFPLTLVLWAYCNSQLEQLDPDSNPMEHMLERYPGDRSNSVKMELRRYIANFGLGGDDLPLQKISTMSGGQKCRLCLAAALYRRPHLIILDEPTNHLGEFVS
jgi:ATPase subunit of ABC transporter with duplicated ATPase domains